MSDYEQHQLNHGLRLSILNGDLHEVSYFIDEGADIEARLSPDDLTPLGLALKEKRYDAAAELAAAGADVNAADPSTGETILHAAARNDDIQAVQWLLKNGAAASITNKTGKDALYYTGDETIREILEAQVKIDTCLLNACEGGRTDDIRDFIADGANIHARTHDGMTALQTAVREKNYEAAFVLLQAGADVNAVYEASRNTSLHYACNNNDLPMVRLLLEYGADVDVKNMYGQTPVHRAAVAGSRDIAEALANADASALLIKDDKNLTAANIACAQADKKGASAAFQACARYLSGKETLAGLVQQATKAAANREQLHQQTRNKFRL